MPSRTVLAHVGITGQPGVVERLAQAIRRLGASLTRLAERMEQWTWRRQYPVTIAPYTMSDPTSRPVVLYYRARADTE